MDLPQQHHVDRRQLSDHRERYVRVPSDGLTDVRSHHTDDDFTDAKGDFLPVDQWPSYGATVVCRTSTCPSAGVAHVILLHANRDNAFRASCYGCGQTTEVTMGEQVSGTRRAAPVKDASHREGLRRPARGSGS
jgi:hypothetical protein